MEKCYLKDNYLPIKLTAKIQLEQIRLKHTEMWKSLIIKTRLAEILKSKPKVSRRHQCLYRDLKIFSFCLRHGDILCRHRDRLYILLRELDLEIVYDKFAWIKWRNDVSCQVMSLRYKRVTNVTNILLSDVVVYVCW